MLKITLPSDNFYKMLFFLGIVFVASKFLSTYYILKLDINSIRLSGELEETKLKKKWVDLDYNSYREGIEYLEKFEKWEQPTIQALNPGSEDAKIYTEMTGMPVEPNIAELLINLDSEEERKNKKFRAIKEMQSQLENLKGELKTTNRHLDKLEINLKTKENELFQTEQALKYTKIFVNYLFVIGICFILIGGLKWYMITQKNEDVYLKNQANILK